MQKWEYLFFRSENDIDYDLISTYGELGWELVSFIFAFETLNKYRYIFKRPLVSTLEIPIPVLEDP
jgi:hypothetical protein